MGARGKGCGVGVGGVGLKDGGDKLRYVMERRDHKTMPKQISVKEKLRPKMAHGAKLLKPSQTDLAARKQTGPHNDNHAPTLSFQAGGREDKRRE